MNSGLQTQNSIVFILCHTYTVYRHNSCILSPPFLSLLPPFFSCLEPRIYVCSFKSLFLNMKYKNTIGTSQVLQWLRLRAFIAGGGDWILGQETKIPHAVRCSQNKVKLLLRTIWKLPRTQVERRIF